jgi:hypothetical protein
MAEDTDCSGKGKPKARPDDLAELIKKLISEDPLQHAGHAWAARHQDVYAQALGVSSRTVRNWITAPPFVTACRKVDGAKLSLLRIGEPGPPSAVDVAKAMSKAWRQTFSGRPTNKHEFGCLIGLAERWPEAHAVAVFRHALANWTFVMAGVEMEIDLLPEEERLSRYYKHPSISVMRRFPDPVLEAYIMHMQDKHSEASMKAGLHKLYPDWPS